ncbi:hypothetical protein [Kiloniella sp. EL199]|uniref:hypothetical protein n=1 Tax=Kiloniella sp. EL199 TaxID=2107581 RepID=UPI000EA17F24|nr:hypothetical protein [Kiloniella sp. EL199]
MRTQTGSTKVYCLSTLLVFFLGLMPVFFNAIIDPYERHQLIDLDLDKKKVSEKAHYPLWKINHYPENTTNIIILGDSRARALRDKYWHELGLKGAYNFAYGGATIYEIYDTFNYVKDNPNLKKLIIGIQLRSFDEDHKGGLNRVPEAIRLHQNTFQYYSNWFVSRIALKNLERKYKSELKQITSVLPSIISAADAQNLNLNNGLEKLIDPENCRNCLLPQGIPSSPYRTQHIGQGYYFGHDLGRWGRLWDPISIDRTLPKKFDKQVLKNARSDWQAFHFSEKLWAYLIDIATWCQKNNVELVFVIPPTIVEMQQRIVDFGYGDLNHEFRKNLSRLGAVIDFDFVNEVTLDLTRFTDAYHFDYKLSKLMVGEITRFIKADTPSTKFALKRRKDVICPIRSEDISNKMEDETFLVKEGQACRIWSMKNDG